MSVKRFKHVSDSSVDHDFLAEIGGIGVGWDDTEYVLASDYDSLAAELAWAKDHIETLLIRYCDPAHARADKADASIRDLETALREIANFAEQFIGDDEDGDERMYKVHQIADNAIPFTAETEAKS